MNRQDEPQSPLCENDIIQVKFSRVVSEIHEWTDKQPQHFASIPAFTPNESTSKMKSWSVQTVQPFLQHLPMCTTTDRQSQRQHVVGKICRCECSLSSEFFNHLLSLGASKRDQIVPEVVNRRRTFVSKHCVILASSHTSLAPLNTETTYHTIWRELTSWWEGKNSHDGGLRSSPHLDPDLGWPWKSYRRECLIDL